MCVRERDNLAGLWKNFNDWTCFKFSAPNYTVVFRDRKAIPLVSKHQFQN